MRLWKRVAITKVSPAVCVSGHRGMLAAWLSDRTNLAFSILLVLHLLPVWAFEYFPSQDGPNHLYNANIRRQYARPEATAFRKYYFLNEGVETNWLSSALLMGLLGITPTRLAERLFLTGYVLLFPLSVRYAVRAINPQAIPIALLAFPLLYSTPVNLGFYSFTYSLPFFFFTVGYFMKPRVRLALAEAALLALLSLFLYLFHVFSWAMAAIALVLLTAWEIGVALARPSLGASRFWPSTSWPTVRSSAIPLLSLLPGALLMLRFVRTQGGTRSIRPEIPRLKILFQSLLKVIVSFDAREALVAAFLAGGFILLAFFLLASKLVKGSFTKLDGLLAVSGAYLGLALVAPAAMLGGTFVRSRLFLFEAFALILWFGAQHYGRTLSLVVAGAAAGSAIVLLGLRSQTYFQVNSSLREYVSAGRFIAPNTTLLPVCFRPNGVAPNGESLTVFVEPFLHAGDYIAADRLLVDLTNYEANEKIFPVRFRAGLNPYSEMGDIEGLIGPVDFAGYQQRTSGTVDYILLWGMNYAPAECQQARSAIEAYLRAGYARIFVSSPRGLAELYRRRSLSPSAR